MLPTINTKMWWTLSPSHGPITRDIQINRGFSVGTPALAVRMHMHLDQNINIFYSLNYKSPYSSVESIVQSIAKRMCADR